MLDSLTAHVFAAMCDTFGAVPRDSMLSVGHELGESFHRTWPVLVALPFAGLGMGLVFRFMFKDDPDAPRR